MSLFNLNKNKYTRKSQPRRKKHWKELMIASKETKKIENFGKKKTKCH
jgi:hypothetical protein